MFSPLNDPQVEDWFQRLNAAWKRMPADEQVRQREEVQQHLESLIADREKQGEAPDTAWRVALDQFGDPESFGRRIAEEWRQSKRGFRADLTAIGFGLGLNILFWLFAGPLCGLWFQSLRDAHGIGVFTFVGALRLVIGYSGLILVNSAIGLRYPLQALKGAFYSHILWETWTAGTTFMLLIALTAHSQNGLAFNSEGYLTSEENRFAIVHSLLRVPLWWLLATAISYLASVTKRGWYRPTWDDFKLTLPKRGRVAR